MPETEPPKRMVLVLARRWIYDEFQRISAACGGCLEVYYSSDIIEGTPRIPNPVDVGQCLLLFNVVRPTRDVMF